MYSKGSDYKPQNGAPYSTTNESTPSWRGANFGVKLYFITYKVWIYIHILVMPFMLVITFQGILDIHGYTLDIYRLILNIHRYILYFHRYILDIHRYILDIQRYILYIHRLMEYRFTLDIHRLLNT